MLEGGQCRKPRLSQDGGAGGHAGAKMSFSRGSPRWIQQKGKIKQTRQRQGGQGPEASVPSGGAQAQGLLPTGGAGVHTASRSRQPVSPGLGQGAGHRVLSDLSPRCASVSSLAQWAWDHLPLPRQQLDPAARRRCPGPAQPQPCAQGAAVSVTHVPLTAYFYVWKQVGDPALPRLPTSSLLAQSCSQGFPENGFL